MELSLAGKRCFVFLFSFKTTRKKYSWMASQSQGLGRQHLALNPGANKDWKLWVFKAV
jgi:hypothetical protein